VVADDDDAFRESLLIWLSDKQCTTREASNGVEALDNLDDAVDILVLDREMPKLSGPEVVERLSETPFSGSTIVLSANRPDACLDEDDVETYVQKPINRENFLNLVEQYLR
jgi:CheY-like chemotaxis protein